jgi:hypothetical protein
VKNTHFKKEREEMARRAVRARHSRRGEHGDHNNNNNNSGEIEQWENSVYFGKKTDQWEMHKSTLRHSLHGNEHKNNLDELINYERCSQRGECGEH